MRKLGYISIIMLAGLFVISCQKEDIGPNADTMVVPEWENSMNRGSEGLNAEGWDDEDDGDINPDGESDGIVDPNNDGDGREN